MAALKKMKRQEIPFVLDGNRIIKCVTKNTTCSDVIKMLPNLQTPLAVFESVDGIEKELTGKTKLLKVWRANGANRNVEFVIRKSQMLSKMKRSTKKTSPDNKSFTHSSAKSAKVKELSKETLKQLSDQKTKFQAQEQNSGINSAECEQNRLMRRMTSNASINSMDAFLAKADLKEMAKFLSFCGEVTNEKLGKRKERKKSAEICGKHGCDKEQTIGSSNTGFKYNKKVIRKFTTLTKLGLKQNFIQKRHVERTTSTGTICSTDTGYHSNNSECEHITTTLACSVTDTKYRTQILTNLSDIPRHSTPIKTVRTLKRRVDDIELTLNDRNSYDAIKHMDEVHGKSVILQKFMKDQILSVSSELTDNDVCDSLDVNETCKRRYSMSSFKSQKDICHFLWANNCDSDSECESDISEPCENLDIAFNAGETYYISQPRKLRRESAILNLNRLSHLSRDFEVDTEETFSFQTKTLRRESSVSNLNQVSLLSRDIGLYTFNDSNGFKYSFDHSFPRMDETISEDLSMDFSYDYDESDSENESYCNEDDCMDSFMKTRSLIDSTFCV